ncbi:hypothetical protein Q2E61_01690 [Microbulbifer thermotolerans]|uniref:hypothetical protein n=1 Tax=Microbulbifer thermotolerans TaxID=252514 RepID=UPI0026735F23|nr:hypothetical protein [Microbulbifer thermotolerans]WKT60941.1 hypothetical protein Q2E61_01690 [Microbulbifer thermotolerans]
MIYRLKFDRNRFLSFDITPEQWMEKLGPSYIFMLDEPQWSDFWPPINGQFFNHSDGDKLPKVPEICVWFMHDLVLNAEVRKALEQDHPEWIQSCGELLPIRCENIDYYVWHITHIVDDKCIDNTRSQRLLEESGHIELQALAFKPCAESDLPLFHTHYDGARALFCNDTFKQWVDGRGLQGLVFDTQLANPF